MVRLEREKRRRRAAKPNCTVPSPLLPFDFPLPSPPVLSSAAHSPLLPLPLRRFPLPPLSLFPLTANNTLFPQSNPKGDYQTSTGITLSNV